MKKTISRKQFLPAKRQPPNLKRLLTSATFSDKPICYSVKKCGLNCETCKIIKDGPSVKFKKGNNDFHVKNNFSCLTKNVIYVLFCNACGAEYIGETGNELKTRMTVHRQQIRDASLRHLKVSKHIHACGKGFIVYPFYKVPNNASVHDRRLKESHFINKYQPELNAD